jgi:hypothetical protein
MGDKMRLENRTIIVYRELEPGHILEGWVVKTWCTNSESNSEWLCRPCSATNVQLASTLESMVARHDPTRPVAHRQSFGNGVGCKMPAHLLILLRLNLPEATSISNLPDGSTHLRGV